MRRLPWFLLPPLILLGVWDLAVRWQWVAPGIIPAPTQVAESWYRWIFGAPTRSLSPYSGTWTANVLYSARRVLQGFGPAAALGLPLGILIGLNPALPAGGDPPRPVPRPVPPPGCAP